MWNCVLLVKVTTLKIILRTGDMDKLLLNEDQFDVIRKSVRRLLAASCTNWSDHKTSHKTLVAPHPQIIFSGTWAYSTEPLDESVLRVENSGTNTQIIEWCKGFLDCFEKMEQWQKLIRIRSVLGWPIGFVFTLLVKVGPFFFADQIRPALTCHNASFNALSTWK